MNKLTIGIVAGEISGDSLGADFMAKMNALHPNIHWVGVGGANMQTNGLTSIIKMERLSVMGLTEVVQHLPDLLSAKSKILKTFKKSKIDIFVGIDAPDFNLRLAKSLKKNGVFTVQYVSPSVWAWRESRIHNIINATNLVLCLFPFETDVYKQYKHPAVCVGHPLIKNLHPANFHRCNNTICLMGGSRLSEIHAILPNLLQAFSKLHHQNPSLTALLPLAKDEHKKAVQTLIDKNAPHLQNFMTILTPRDWQLLDNYDKNYTASQYAMQISNLTILASGTATLEGLMLHAPMLVVYLVNPTTYQIAKHLVKIPFVTLPNILHHHLHHTPLIVELIQHQATPESIAHYAQATLADNTLDRRLTEFADELKTNQAINPAEVVLTHYQHHHKP